VSGAALLAAVGGPPLLSAGAGNVTDSFVGVASASLTFETDGDRLATTIVGGAIDEGDWIHPKALAATLNGQCTIRAHLDSSSGSGLDGSSAALDSDLALSTARAWIVNQSGSGTSQATLTFTIKFNGATLHSVQRVLTATVP
jgi:hypothetical protein